MKKIGIILLILCVVSITLFYYIGGNIARISIKSMIVKSLPPYVDVENVILDTKRKILEINGFSIRNPEGYESEYFAHIDKIIFAYSFKGKTILSGLINRLVAQ